MKIIASVTILLLCNLISCQSVENIIAPKTETMESYAMMNGKETYNIQINRSFIVGIVADDFSHLDNFSEVLKELDLEHTTVSINRINMTMQASDLHFTFLKKADQKSISQDNSPELKKLRELYWNNFGPGIYRESGEIFGVLSNAITVYFEPRINPEKIDSLLKSSGAIKIVQLVEYRYHVEYPKSWGYKMLDMSKELFELEEISATENEYRVIHTLD